MEFDKSIVDFPNNKRFPGGASNDMNPDLQHPNNPVPLMDLKKTIFAIGSAGLARKGQQTLRAPENANLPESAQLKSEARKAVWPSSPPDQAHSQA